MNPKSRASNKYNKANTRTFLIRLNKKTDAEIINKLLETRNKTAYIRTLISKDMNL